MSILFPSCIRNNQASQASIDSIKLKLNSCQSMVNVCCNGQSTGIRPLKKLMLNGIGFVTGEPTLKLNYPFVSHPGMQITATGTGDLKWVYLMLPLCKGDTIKAITITYKNSNARSFISQIRLVNQISPSPVGVIHDDGTDLLATTVTTYTSPANNIVDGSTVLNLRLMFGNAADMIEIGAVQIDYK